MNEETKEHIDPSSHEAVTMALVEREVNGITGEKFRPYGVKEYSERQTIRIRGNENGSTCFGYF